MSSEHDEQHFDSWYARLSTSAAREELVQRHLGLPPVRLVTGLVPWDGLGAVESALRLAPYDVLLDLGCGRGGYGLELASRTRARLVGVDFSEEAVRQATANAEAEGAEADFRVGDLASTGLDDAAVDAVVCLDSVQFSRHEDATCLEVRRVLVPGGRVVMTHWEARERGDQQVSPSLRTLDVALALRKIGFTDVEREVCDDWAEVERGLWEEAVALDTGGDANLEGLAEEGRRVLDGFDRVERVMVSATAPA